MLSDLAIAQAATLRPIADIAADYALPADDLDQPVLTVLVTQFIVLLAAFTLVCNVVIQPWR